MAIGSWIRLRASLDCKTIAESNTSEVEEPVCQPVYYCERAENELDIGSALTRYTTMMNLSYSIWHSTGIEQRRWTWEVDNGENQRWAPQSFTGREHKYLWFITRT